MRSTECLLVPYVIPLHSSCKKSDVISSNVPWPECPPPPGQNGVHHTPRRVYTNTHIGLDLTLSRINCMCHDLPPETSCVEFTSYNTYALHNIFQHSSARTMTMGGGGGTPYIFHIHMCRQNAPLFDDFSLAGHLKNCHLLSICPTNSQANQIIIDQIMY